MDCYNVRPPLDSVQLGNITPITMFYGTYNELVTGANQKTNLETGGPTLYDKIQDDKTAIDHSTTTIEHDYRSQSFNLLSIMWVNQS